MKIIIASANKGKIEEINKLLPNHETIAFKDILGEIDIIENGNTFKENAIIKAKTIMDKLKDINYDKEYIVLADDSGITVPELNNEPNIYSARYAGVGASDKENLNKLISRLKENNLERSPAFYTACIAVGFKNNIYTTHGWMYGDVIDEARGDKGFGYDPMFIPKGYDKTLGELSHEIKKDLSHRSKGLALAMRLITSLLR